MGAGGLAGTPPTGHHGEMHEPGADLLPDGVPFLLPGGSTGCVLVHGFTAMPGEMRWLGEDLASRGNTVVGIRLPGHGAAMAAK